jgi:hypothetical protein
MPKNKAKKQAGNETLAGVKKQMAQPRVAKSARKTYANLSSPVLFTKAGKPHGGEQVKSHFEGEV